MQTASPASGFRLSPQQRYLWRQQQYQKRNHRLIYTVQIQGPLLPAYLEEAMLRIIQRYENLRTTFTTVPGVSIPVQSIGTPSFFYQEITLDTLQEQSQQQRITEVLQQELYNAQENGQPRLILLTLAPQHYLLLLNLAGLCADEGTMHFLLQDLWHEYQQALAGEPAMQEEDVIQYADLAEGLNELLEAPETPDGQLFWKKQMARASFQAELPFERYTTIAEADHQYPAQISFNYHAVPDQEGLIDLDPTSLEAILLTCWGTLLSRLTNQQELTLGIAATCRKFEDLQRAFGPLTSDVPLIIRVDEQHTIREAIAHVQQALQQAVQWSEYFSWESLQGNTAMEHLHASFPFAFSYSELPEEFELAHMIARITSRQETLVLAGLRIHCQRQQQVVRCTLTYDPTRYERQAIEQLADQFVTLLRQINHHPDAPIHTLTQLSEAQKELLLARNNATRTVYEVHHCLHLLVSEQAARTPYHPAIRYGERQLTYAELETQANQLAHLLQKRGIGPEDCVAVFLEPSLELVITLLAILKAGAAYLPIDLVQPQERAYHFFTNSNARLLITRQHFLQQIAYESIPALCLDSDGAALREESPTPPDSTIQADNLAYILYTSGSTGHPKGVMITHRALCNRLLWSQHCYPLTSADRILQAASIGFDFSAWEIFGPLIAGATLIVVPWELYGDSRRLTRLMVDQQVTVAHFVPSLLHLVLEDSAFPLCSQLRLVLSGGEALPRHIYQQFHAYSQATLYNQYGPTEATIDATYWQSIIDYPYKHPPIGRPLANTEIYVLDAQLQPVPCGITGELYIGGTGLARGYCQNPDLTAERFIPHPFSQWPGERLYRTGDLARYLPDAQLEFLGRNDLQVKLRGIRVETEEIAFHLLQHPEIRQALVRLCTFSSGEQQLVAYVVAEHGQEISSRTCLDFLQ
ncbi:MAG TPA: amino acid adenylation domain-containing protein, partial [Ktedonobacteraceae bacterium]|nr:amino acid adenylation domain-containing protein [Ktedonobacteraceae bacterium]